MSVNRNTHIFVCICTFGNKSPLGTMFSFKTLQGEYSGVIFFFFEESETVAYLLMSPCNKAIIYPRVAVLDKRFYMRSLDNCLN